MTERERFIKALRREPIEGHCPTFEMGYNITLEKFGKLHPCHEAYSQWDQMEPIETEAHFRYWRDIFIQIAEEFHYSAIQFVEKIYRVPEGKRAVEGLAKLVGMIREISKEDYYMTVPVSKATLCAPTSREIPEFTKRLQEDAAGLKAEAQKKLEESIRQAEGYAKHPQSMDGFTLCPYYGFEEGSPFTAEVFSDLVAPYLEELIKTYHDLGFYCILHSTGNILPVIAQMVDCKPDALHSIDPRAGMDLAEIKKQFGDRVALCGNVDAQLLKTGSAKAVAEDARRALKQGMDGWGYIFCTSDLVSCGSHPEQYDVMNKIWWEEGVY